MCQSDFYSEALNHGSNKWFVTATDVFSMSCPVAACALNVAYDQVTLKMMDAQSDDNAVRKSPAQHLCFSKWMCQDLSSC